MFINKNKIVVILSLSFILMLGKTSEIAANKNSTPPSKSDNKKNFTLLNNTSPSKKIDSVGITNKTNGGLDK